MWRLQVLKFRLYGLTVYPVKQRLNEIRAYTVARNLEAYRVYTPAKYVKSLDVGGLCIIGHDVLAHIPAVAGFLVATHIWELARQSVRCVKFQYVLPAVERRHVEAFVGPPDKTFVEVSAFQVDLYLVKPFLACGRFELAEEFFLYSLT